MTSQLTEKGHGQPPKKGLRKNLTLGASLVDPVNSQAPPNSNALQPCRVILEQINSSKFKYSNQPHKL